MKPANATKEPRDINFLLLANGIVSLLSAVLFMVDEQWLLTTTGLISYFCWNLLMIVLLILIYMTRKFLREQELTIKNNKDLK